MTQAQSNDETIVTTATYDYLDGTHPAPGGQVIYWYNSLLLFQPPITDIPNSSSQGCDVAKV